MKKLFLLLFIFVCIDILAQESFMKWGVVDIKDLTTHVYPADSNASAVVLGSHCYTYFAYSSGRFQVSYQIHKRIKVLKKEGYQYANIEIPTYLSDNGAREIVENIKGMTYNLNIQSGIVERTPLEEKSVFKEVLRQHKGRSINLVKFALPNIKEGSVIEYSYTLTSDFITILNAWEFQEKIPTRKSEFVIKMIGELSYVYVIQTSEPFTISPDANTKVSQANAGADTYRWVQENIPAFRDESFIATADDYIGKIQFQLASYQFPNSSKKEIFSTWEKTISELWADTRYGGFVKRKGVTKELVASLTMGKDSEKEKMEAIYEYVKNNFKAENRVGVWTENTPKEVVENKRGNKHEINLLLINMLKEAGLDANPVLLSTRSHGRIYKNYPILERFNYSIGYVKIGEEEFLLDATNPIYPLGMLPADVLNGEGLLMKKEGKESKWLDLQNRHKSSKMWVFKLNLKDDGVLEGQSEVSLQGYEAIKLRQKYIKLQNEHGGEIAKEETGKRDEYDFFRDSIENLHHYDKALKGKKSFESNQFVEQIGQLVYLNPLLDFKMKENPLKAKERKHLIDFAYPFEESFFMNFFIPENYQIEEIPKSERLQWADKSVRFDYLASANGNMIQVICKLIINRAIFAPSEYKDLRDTFAKIVAKQNEQIVLKKK